MLLLRKLLQCGHTHTHTQPLSGPLSGTTGILLVQFTCLRVRFRNLSPGLF